MNRRFALFFLTSLTALLPGMSRADLASYLKKTEPAYKWEKTGQTTSSGVTIYDLHMVSQTWQNMNWEHHVQVFRPENVKHSDFCVLLNTGGNGGDSDTALGVTLAKATGSNLAVVYNIPNQPLYGGKSEDALVVYTWQKFLETGDESWPLHFPMAKAVIETMDTVQSLFKKENLPPVNRFLVTGASKRGWTTWLVGASRDPRVKAIAPMVIDTLNLAAQVPHQLEMYGKPSEQIDDYSSTGMLEQLGTPKGKRLIELEDPYSYRDILTLPKLIINGTNDRYWAQDALNLYWDGLKGPKWVLYVPNSGHGLEDRLRVLSTISVFAQTIADSKLPPKMAWNYTQSGNNVTLNISSTPSPKSARLFRVYSKTRDFRDGKWTYEEMTGNNGVFTGNFKAPDEGWAAIYGEVTYELNGRFYNLSTQIKIVGSASK